MRYPQGHKEAVRERILSATAGALRRHGLDGLGIPALMERAGLTHGGFYSHFASRDELVAEAVLHAADQTGRSVLGTDRSLKQTDRDYLSRAHLESPEGGCVLAALGCDAPRQPTVVRRAFATAARGFVRLLERKLHPHTPRDRPSDEALRHASTLIGAVVLARLVDDPALADRILASARTDSHA